METDMHTDIQINDKYKSSVRLDALTDNYLEFVDSLILHGTLQNTLQTVCSELQGSAQRAFTITGPYGSGKSTLAAFLAGVIGTDNQNRKVSLAKLKQVPQLASALNDSFEHVKGWAVVKHVCGLNDPAEAIAKSVSHKLSNSAASLSPSENALGSIELALDKASSQYDGVLILLDELGKALDYQSNNDGDLYFFQELADLAQKSKTPVIIIGFLHQAFGQYAKGKDALTQKEWAKVQGRYRDLSYNPTVDESLILISDSIKVESSLAGVLREKYKLLVESVIDEYPKFESSKSSLLNALPLDPAVSLLLGPISRRRFSQNERSIFGFLASSERYGFRWFLENQWDSSKKNLYGPELLWDYLETNLGHLINSSPDGKAWLEALDSLHRASQNGSNLHVSITTLIALITIFGQSHQLFATKKLIEVYFESHGYTLEQIAQAISDLEKSAIVIFRKRHNALFIFQGSDIDVNSLVIQEIEAIQDGVSWAHKCHTPSLILASSHYHHTGAMRWANSFFIESEKEIASLDYLEKPKSGEPFTSFILIGETLCSTEVSEISRKYPNWIVGSAATISRLKSAAIEKIAISNVLKRDQRLAHDHIARKELSNRLSDSNTAIMEELDHLFHETEWHFKGYKPARSPLSKLASLVAGEIYSSSPVVINELVNRSRPSGSANSATNKLLAAMLHNASEENLGFKEAVFPPEKGIYLSVLKSSGWHRKTSTGYCFTSDWGSEADLHYRHKDAYALWHAGYEFIRNASSSITISELYEYWMSPPFGLTSGLCRIYALALLKSLEGKVAFYDKDSTQSFIFIPQLDEVFVEKLHRYPHEIAVRYYEIDSVQTHVVKSIATAAQLQSTEESSLLELAKHIVQIAHKLPAWVKKTSGNVFQNDNYSFQLSQEARALRNSALRANDPYKLILEDIPSIFKVSTAKQDDISSINELSEKLRSALDELVSQHTFLISGFKKILKNELSSDFNTSLAKRCDEVAKNAHRPAVKEFARRLSAFIEGENDFEWVISTALGTAERNWTDKHINDGLYEINSLCRQFRREESFNRMTKAVSAKSIGLITTDNSGEYIELEGHIANAATETAGLDEAKDAVSEKIAGLPDDAKREVLVRLLSELMHPIESDTGATINE